MSTLLNTKEIGVRSVDNRSDAYKYKIDTILEDQSIENNKSQITIVFSVKAVKTYYSQWDDGDATWTTTTNNGASINNSSAIRSSKSTTMGSYVEMARMTNWYNNKSDGTLTIQTSITFGFTGTSYLPYQTTITTDNVVVTTIPRASYFVTSSATIDMPNSATIQYRGYTNSFTDVLAWSYGSSSGQLDSSASSTSTKSYTFTPSNITDICNVMATRSSASITLTLKTYSGSTLIGTSTISVLVRINTQPSVSMSAVTSSVASTLGLSSCMIAGYGTGTMQVSVASSHSWDKATYSVSGVSINRGTASLGTLPIINLGVQPSSSTDTTARLSFTITSNRGYNEQYTYDMVVKGYTPPNITNYYANRSGTTITMGWTYSVMSIGNNAVQTHTIKLGSGSAVSVNSGASTTAQLSASSSSTATFYLSDKITSTQQVKAVPRLQVPISLYDGGGTTLATSFGEQATNYGSGANYVNFASGTTLRGIDSNNAIYTRDAWQVIKGELKTGDAYTLDANDLTLSGTYYLTDSSSNIPVANYGTVTVMTTATYVTQFFTRMTTGSDFKRIWLRKYNNGSWTSWALINSDYLPLAGGTITGGLHINNNGSYIEHSFTRGSTGHNGIAKLYSDGDSTYVSEYNGSTTGVLRMNGETWHPQTNKGLNLGGSSYQFNDLYAYSIYQNGQPVANYNSIVWTGTINKSSSTTITLSLDSVGAYLIVLASQNASVWRYAGILWRDPYSSSRNTIVTLTSTNITMSLSSFTLTINNTQTQYNGEMWIYLRRI